MFGQRGRATERERDDLYRQRGGSLARPVDLNYMLAAHDAAADEQ